jgi:hypothetical protein
LHIGASVIVFTFRQKAHTAVMPTLDLSELNIVIAVLGAFIVAYGFFSVKIKQVWYLGEARKSFRFSSTYTHELIVESSCRYLRHYTGAVSGQVSGR